MGIIRWFSVQWNVFKVYRSYRTTMHIFISYFMFDVETKM